MQDAGCFHWIGLPSFFNSSVMMTIQQLCTAPIPAARLNCWTALVELSAGSCWKCPDHRTCHREAGGYCILILRSAVKCTQLFWALERRIHPIGLTGSCLVLVYDLNRKTQRTEGLWMQSLFYLETEGRFHSSFCRACMTVQLGLLD